jgi:hypothetical protein
MQSVFPFSFVTRGLFAAVALFSLLSTSPGYAQESTAEAARSIKSRVKRRSGSSRRATQPAHPSLAQTRPTTPPPEPGARIDLTLTDAVQRSLERNLDISVERLNPQSFDFSIAGARRDLSADVHLESRRAQPVHVPAHADGRRRHAGDRDADRQHGPFPERQWGGGSFAVGFNNNRQAQSDAFATRNPALNSNLTAVYVQPLLRNFRIDNTRAALRITKLNQEVSEITLRGTIVRTLANVRNAYWDFAYAIQAADVAERSLTLATKLVEDNQARVEIGTMAPLDIVQAQAEEATRRQTLAQAVATRPDG